MVWVQGCAIRCEGCIVPETWGKHSGTMVNPRVLARRLLEDNESDLTVSGGEPTEQAAAVAALLREAHQLGRTTWVYTGRYLDDLVSEGDEAILTMLDDIDVLVDGPFEHAVSGGAPYRGSRNQRILHLTNAISRRAASGGAPGKIELRIGDGNELTLFGIPEPGTLERLRAGLKQRGLYLKMRG